MDKKQQLHQRFQHVEQQGQTRFTVTSLLAGLTFGAFAATVSLRDIAAELAWPFSAGWSKRDDMLWFGLFLLGLAALLFLLSATGVYYALHELADIPHAEAKALRENTGRFAPRVLDPKLEQHIQRAYSAYKDTSALLPWGLACAFGTLPCVAAYVNTFLGAVMATIMVLIIILSLTISRPRWLARLILEGISSPQRKGPRWLARLMEWIRCREWTKTRIANSNIPYED